MSLDIATVKKVATLARLRMDQAELEKMAPKLSNIIGFVEQLEQVNTDNVEPLASVVNIPITMREDIVNDGHCVDKILANAPEKSQGYFVVGKVVE